MHWDQWIGPAPYRPYHPAYAPFRWRGWWDFGVGALGDMGAHIIDHPYWALKLDKPVSVQATSTPYNDDSYPLATVVTYKFPERDNMPSVTMKWFDGGLMPPRPDDLEEGRMMGSGGGGIIFYGTKGKLMASVYGNNPRLIPETFMQKVGLPKKTIKRSPGIYQEWVDAIRNNGPEPTSNFSYASGLTETMLLGNIAVKFQEDDTILQYDAENMRVTNLEKANDLLHYEYRDGYTL
jgi:predicted dehydrogenase